MPQAYVIGALIPRGGAFMAYHLGVILQQQFGYELVSVQVQPPAVPQFEYDVTPRRVEVAEMEKRITPDDILVVNSSFSRFMFGLRLPGRKVCYVQDFRTFSILDCGFDLYVSTSAPVQKFLQAIYGIGSNVIPPFVQWERMPAAPRWDGRPPGSVLLYVKDGEENRMVGDYLQRGLTNVPGLKLDVVRGQGMTHSRLMRRIGQSRYLINVSLAEGFGLLPLEAMAMGTCVLGLDGVGGRDYMHFGKNSMTFPARDLKRIPDAMAQLVQDEDKAAALAAQGAADAKRYTKEVFSTAWTSALKPFLG